MIDSRTSLKLHPAMADSPRITEAKRREHAGRAERLARALRENLRRRKAQARAKQEQSDDTRRSRGGTEPAA